jgi:hypothetical protein
MKTKKFVKDMNKLIISEKEWIKAQVEKEEYLEAGDASAFIAGVGYALEMLDLDKERQASERDSSIYIEVEKELTAAKKANKKAKNGG